VARFVAATAAWLQSRQGEQAFITSFFSNLRTLLSASYIVPQDRGTDSLTRLIK
jgi:hypothetical protein